MHQGLWSAMAAALAVCLMVRGVGAAAPDTSSTTPPPKEKDPGEEVVISRGSRGFELATRDGKFKLQIQSRLQLRASTPFDADPVFATGLDARNENTFKINRGRIRLGGNAFAPWLGYNWEYELSQNALLDFRLSVTRFQGASFRFGQWKADYNRDRIISSAAQQTIDRSLIARPFTLDRQQGVSMYGHLKGTGVADFNYWGGVFTGTGRGARTNDDGVPMFVGRWQWNVFGRELPFEGSDTKYHEKPAGALAVAGATNRSRFTAFATAGGIGLEGFGIGEAGQYRVNQMVLDTGLMFRGFSWQQELHWKQIDDRDTTVITTLTGNYIQFGYFFHHWLEWVPAPLELAFRHAIYDPNWDVSDDIQQEFSLDGNWFMNGHQNKLTAEISLLDYEQAPPDHDVGKLRFRLQWDITL